jgi:hypothetical protein
MAATRVTVNVSPRANRSRDRLLVAADAGALIDDEELLDCARAVCAIFADVDAGGGLPRSVILDRARGPWSPQTLAGRVELFMKLGLLQTILDKNTSSATSSTPPDSWGCCSSTGSLSAAAWTSCSACSTAPAQ